MDRIYVATLSDQMDPFSLQMEGAPQNQKMTAWRFLPIICFEACIQNPFILDLLRTETCTQEIGAPTTPRVGPLDPDSIDG